MKQYIWNSKSGIPYITYCEDDGTPIYSVYFENEKQRLQAIKRDSLQGIKGV